MTIGGTQVQPGTYSLKAEEGKSELQVVKVDAALPPTIANGKVVTTIPCHWTELTAKPFSSRIYTDGDKVTQVEFAGRTSAIQFNQ